MREFDNFPGPRSSVFINYNSRIITSRIIAKRATAKAAFIGGIGQV